MNRKTRYLIYSTIAIIAVVAVVFFNRDSKHTETSESTTQMSPLPTAPLRMEFLKEGLLSFYTPNDDYVASIDIELAESNDERQMGLMYREEMDENQGMFFIFPFETIQSFWMKNTPLSLDMIFINQNQEIVTIHRNTTPFATTSYASTAPSKFVLEVNAGFTDRLGITEGYKIGWMHTN